MENKNNTQKNDTKNVLKKVAVSCVESKAKSFVVKTATKKFVDSEVGQNTCAVMTKTIKKCVDTMCQSSAGKTILKKAAQGICGKAVKGAAARSVATKAVRGNVITNTIMFAVNTVPDIYCVCTGKITAKEYGQRTAVNAASTAGSSAGSFIGMTVGTAICPGIGTAIGSAIGGIAGSMIASKGLKKCFSNQ